MYLRACTKTNTKLVLVRIQVQLGRPSWVWKQALHAVKAQQSMVAGHVVQVEMVWNEVYPVMCGHVPGAWNLSSIKGRGLGLGGWSYITCFLGYLQRHSIS